MLRVGLDAAGLHATRVVGADTNWGFADDVLRNPALAASIDAIAAHYPGGHSSASAEATGLPLWASEEVSTFNNRVGAACLARVLNQGFVGGNLTSVVVWNLVSAYVLGTNWYRAGLLNAMHPWASSYGTFNSDGTWSAGALLWAAAHTTHFTRADGRFFYLHPGPGGGSGMLQAGGSYVTLRDFSSGDVTIVVEKMSSQHSQCVRPGLAPFFSGDETVSFQLAGALADTTTLHAWKTHWAWDDRDTTTEFEQQPDVVLVNGSFTFELTVDSLWTFSTMDGGCKGTPPATTPPPAYFPHWHSDDFSSCSPPSEGHFVYDQSGAFECAGSGDAAHPVVMRASTPAKPVPSGGDILPYSLVGSRDAVNTSVALDFRVARAGESVLLGARAQNGMTEDGSGVTECQGVILALNASRSALTPASWALYSSVSAVAAGSAPLAHGATAAPVAPSVFYSLRLDVNGTTARAWLDGAPLTPADGVDILHTGLGSGHALVGTAAYGHRTELGRVALASAYSDCGSGGAAALVAGAQISVIPCGSELGGPRAGSAWAFVTSAPPAARVNGSFALRAAPELCLSLDGGGRGVLAHCAPSPAQVFEVQFEGVDPDGERQSSVRNPASGTCLSTPYDATSGTALVAAPCNGRNEQQQFHDYESGEITNQWTASCLGVC